MTLTVLRAARLFDGTTLVPTPTVLIDDTHVVATGITLPNAHTVDLGDVTLLPGMVDPHVHLAFDGSEDPVAALATRTPAQTRDAMAEAARRTLRHGVTTVRDLGDRDFLSLALRIRPDLPTIVAAGPPITPVGGHYHQLGGATEGTEAAVRAAVRERADRGCDVIKVMAGFTRAVLRAAVDEAHRNGLPITMHAATEAAVEAGVEAGVDGLEHATFQDDHLLDEITAGPVTVGATLGADVPPEVMATYARLVRTGTVVVAGTDAGTDPGRQHSPLPRAVPQLVALGMSTQDALRTVTSEAARICGLASRKGRLAPGFDADLVAVAGDPLADPAALLDVRAVYLAGRLIAPRS